MSADLVHHLSNKRHESIYWKTSYSSSFYLSALKTLVKTEEELLAIDFEDLVNGLGGAMGLFLGWSLLNIINQCIQILGKIHFWFVDKLNVKC